VQWAPWVARDEERISGGELRAKQQLGVTPSGVGARECDGRGDRGLTRELENERLPGRHARVNREQERERHEQNCVRKRDYSRRARNRALQVRVFRTAVEGGESVPQTSQDSSAERRASPPLSIGSISARVALELEDAQRVLAQEFGPNVVAEGHVG
jgi:hypothetical protein